MIVRLLFDENLAARLVHLLADVYPESQHVEKALGRGATDDAIWAYARSSGLLLVTKDEDFERLSVWRGVGLEQDRRAANRLYRRAAARGDELAMFNLGIVHLDGLGVVPSFRRALAWFEKAAELGDPDAPLQVQDIVREHGLARDARILRWIRRAAEAGDASSQDVLGVALFEGKGVRRDRVEALRWYRKAAKQGEPNAWFNLGQMYRRGHVVRQSWPRALACYRRAASKGHASAFGWLVEHYLGATGAPPEPRKAAAWLRRAEAAALRGEDELCPILGDLYGGEDGRGPDPARAVYWLRRGVARGDVECHRLLGIHCFNGGGVRRDRARAARLYRHAAERGDARAAYLLGLCLRDGDGVRRDRRRAHCWFERAARLGEVDARRELRKRSARLSAACALRARSRS